MNSSASSHDFRIIELFYFRFLFRSFQAPQKEIKNKFFI